MADGGLPPLPDFRQVPQQRLRRIVSRHRLVDANIGDVARRQGEVDVGLCVRRRLHRLGLGSNGLRFRVRVRLGFCRRLGFHGLLRLHGRLRLHGGGRAPTTATTGGKRDQSRNERRGGQRCSGHGFISRGPGQRRGCGPWRRAVATSHGSVKPRLFAGLR